MYGETTPTNADESDQAWCICLVLIFQYPLPKLYDAGIESGCKVHCGTVAINI